MLPLMLNMYVGRLGEAGAPLHPRIESEMANHLGYVDGALAGRDWLMGDFTAADIQMSFVGEVARAFGQTATVPEHQGLGGALPGAAGLSARAGKGRGVQPGPADSRPIRTPGSRRPSGRRGSRRRRPW